MLAKQAGIAIALLAAGADIEAKDRRVCSQVQAFFRAIGCGLHLHCVHGNAVYTFHLLLDKCA